MAQKDLIIGAFTNYNYNQLKPWCESIDKSGFKGDKVLIVGKTEAHTLRELEKRNFITIPMPELDNVPIHVARFLAIYDYLQSTWTNYRYIVTTDVKDVYFQTNPIDLIESGDYKLVIASEGLKYQDEPWGDENLKQAYGPYVYELFKDNEIYNVGTFGGQAEYVKDMVFHIFTNGINRAIPIVDQAVFNVLVNTQPFKDVVHKTVDWACEAGTVADPSKINTFRPNLLCEEPIVKDGIVYYKDKPFAIVHQYDRVPKWKEFVRKEYGQDDESQYFTYRV